MFTTVILAYLSGTQNIDPAYLYIGTVWIDLMAWSELSSILNALL